VSVCRAGFARPRRGGRAGTERLTLAFSRPETCVSGRLTLGALAAPLLCLFAAALLQALAAALPAAAQLALSFRGHRRPV
jgi:hypothetical protein